MASALSPLDNVLALGACTETEIWRFQVIRKKSMDGIRVIVMVIVAKNAALAAILI